MNIKNLMDRALFALSVPKCVCCKERLKYGEMAFCPKCYAEFVDFSTRSCANCSRVLSECDCSTPYLKAHFVRRVVKCYRYINRNDANLGNSLIYSLKRDNRIDVLTVCADILEAAIRNSVENPENCLFTNVPRRKAAIVKYGIDHSGILAKELSNRFGAEYVDILKSNAKVEQKSLESTERLKNADFDIVKNIDLNGREVIIVDDIITSGASMSSAATLIRSLGCRSIIAAALAIAYKDL